MSLLNKLLEKRGIEDINDLSAEEKAVYDNYRVVLSGESVTVENIAEFCRTQIRIIEGKFASIEPNPIINDYYKACLHVYLNILKAIEAPQAERESLERHLTQLLTA